MSVESKLSSQLYDKEYTEQSCSRDDIDSTCHMKLLPAKRKASAAFLTDDDDYVVSDRASKDDTDGDSKIESAQDTEETSTAERRSFRQIVPTVRVLEYIAQRIPITQTKYLCSNATTNIPTSDSSRNDNNIISSSRCSSRSSRN